MQFWLFFFSCYIIKCCGGLLVSFIVIVKSNVRFFAISCHFLFCISSGNKIHFEYCGRLNFDAKLLSTSIP